MPDEQEELETTEQVEGEEGPEPTGEDVVETDTLPEGWDDTRLSKLGFEKKDVGDKRVKDAQSDLHDQRTRTAREIGDLRARLDALAGDGRRSPQATSAQLFERYQQTGTAQDFDAYLRLANAEQLFEVKRVADERTRAAVAQHAFEADRQSYVRDPLNQDMPFEELQHWFEPRPSLNLEESAMVARARRAGSVRNFIEGVAKEGAKRSRSGKPVVSVSTAPVSSGRTSPAPSGKVNPNLLSDEAFMAQYKPKK